MAQSEDSLNEDRFLVLEHMTTEIRKLSMASLMFAKMIWKEELAEKEKGVEIFKMIEEAEEAFVDSALPDRFDRLENLLTVIYQRSKALFLLLEYFAGGKQTRD
jgi:hypothetical protein